MVRSQSPGLELTVWSGLPFPACGTKTPLQPTTALPPPTMSTNPAPTVPSTQSTDPDGLVHGLTVVELQTLSEKCLEARATAYCMHSARIVNALRI